MIKRLLFLIIIYLAVGLQISIAAPIPGLAWDLDIVLLVLIVIATGVGRGEAIIWAAIAGLALDSFDAAAMGGHIVAKSTALFVLGIILDSMNLEQPTLLAATILLLSLIDHLIFRLFSPYATQFAWSFLRYDLPSSIITGLVGLLLLWIAMKLGIFVPRAVEEHNV